MGFSTFGMSDQNWIECVFYSDEAIKTLLQLFLVCKSMSGKALLWRKRNGKLDANIVHDVSCSKARLPVIAPDSHTDVVSVAFGKPETGSGAKLHPVHFSLGGTAFCHENWTGGPIMATKSGPCGPLLVAKTGPPVQFLCDSTLHAVGVGFNFRL